MNQLTILEAIAEGFQKTTQEYILQVSVIAGLLILLFLMSIFFNIYYRKKRYLGWHQDFEDMIRKYDLTINEIDFINELADYLVDKNRKTLLLKNSNTFQNALILWKKNNGRTNIYSARLLKKLFGIEAVTPPREKNTAFGSGRPARFVASDGRTYTGIIGSRDEKAIRLDNILESGFKEKSGRGCVFIHDYKGIISKPVKSVKKLDNGSRLLSLSSDSLHKKVSITEIYIFIPGRESPLKTRLLKLKGETAIIENPGTGFKLDQTLKIAFRRDVDKSYRVNALVTGISLNKRLIRLDLGYLKKGPE